MQKFWVNCPYCGAEIIRGSGYVDLPEVWPPFYRCKICGKLIETGSQEFLTLTAGERSVIKNSNKNSEYIMKSLDRTNNKEYIDFLTKNGLRIYPLTDWDKERFTQVDFEIYGKEPSKEATQSLYNIGALIKEEELDKTTGGIKKEIIAENLMNYKINRLAGVIGGITGFISFFVFMTLFDAFNSGIFILLSLVLAVGIYFVVAVLSAKLLKKNLKSVREKKQNETKKVVNSKDKPQKKDSDSNKNVSGVNVSSVPNAKIQDIEALKLLLDQGTITQEEYKEKALKIINKK